MSTCKVKYIEDRLRKTNPQLADELTDKHIQIFDYVSESKAFNKKEGRYFLNKEGTKKRITQEKIINTVNVNFGDVASIKRNNKGDYFSTNLFENNFINNLFENKKEENASVLLKKIAESNYALKDLASKLLPLLKTDFKVSLVPLINNDSYIEGEYSNLTREIKLKETSINPSRTILHEVIHGLSEMELNNFSKPEISRDFKELFEYTKGMTNSKLYGMTDSSEFLVALFTDVNLINLLKEVPPMNTTKKYSNLFEEIFDFILNTLGFTKENSSLYEQAFSTATNILSEQYKYTDTEGDRVLNQKEKDYIPILYQNISNLQELYNSEDYLDKAYTKIQTLEKTIDYMKESMVFNEQKRFIDQSDVMHYNVLHSSYINSDSKLFPYLQGYQGFVKFLVNDGQFEANANLEYELDLQPITDEEAFSLYNKNLESFKNYIDLKEQEQILDDLKSFKKEKDNIKKLQTQADAFAKSGLLLNMDKAVLNSVGNIKPGVEELFESNPELANAVYEALGFNNFSNQEKEQLIEQLRNPLFDLVRGTELYNKYKGETIPYEYSESSWKLLISGINESKLDLNKILLGYKKRLLEEETTPIRETGIDEKTGLPKGFNPSTGQFEGGFGEASEKENVITKSKQKIAVLEKFIKQKQEALQLYSQYLDTIFPDSKVKDIVYHDSNVDLKTTSFNKDKIGQNDGTVSGNGIGFYSKEDKWLGKRYDKNRQYDNPSIVNLSNFIIKKDFLKLHNANTLEEAVQKATGATLKNISKHNKTVIDVATPLQEKLNVDGVINQFLEGKEYLVFEPEQIHILGNKQDIEGFKKYVSNNNSTLLNSSLFGIETNNQEQLEFHINTLNVIGQFLQNIGVEQRLVPEFLSDNGSIVKGAVAAANFIKGTVDIIDDVNKRPEAWNKLPEEAAHWWYRLLSMNSNLKSALLENPKVQEKIKTLAGTDYENLYTNEGLTEEAIGQLIAESIKRVEEKNAAPEDYSFLKKFIEWINSILDIFRTTSQDPFEVAAMKILSSDISDLMTWEEYRTLNNQIYFSDVLTEQSVATVDYTLIEDIGFVSTNKYEPQEIDEEDQFQFAFKKARKSSPIFETQQELDNWVLANIPEHDERQKDKIQEVRDNQIFFDRLLNKSFKKKTKYLPKTLRKYYNIIDSQNLVPLKEWNISQNLLEITKKLTDTEKQQLINTNGYTNIAPTLRILPDLLKKYGKKTTPEIIKQEIEITNKLIKKEITKEQAVELRQKLENKKKGNPIVLSEPIKIDGAKKQELSILNSMKDMIKEENPSLKSISVEDFVAEVHNWLETNYLLGFADEQAYLTYRVDQTFTNVKDRVSNEDVNIGNMTDEEILALPLEERQRIANIVGLTKKNPDVYHNKVSLRFNDNYHTKSGHFGLAPSAWGNLTYFYTGNSNVKDAVLLHEIQNDNIEKLRETKLDNLDLESSIGTYLQSLNETVISNIQQIESGGKKIIKSMVITPVRQHTQLNYILRQNADLPIEQGLNILKQSLSESMELFRSSNNNIDASFKNIDLAYSAKRKFGELLNRGGIESLLSMEDKTNLSLLIENINKEKIVAEGNLLDQWGQRDIRQPRIVFRNLTILEKKQKFKEESGEIIHNINKKFKELYGENTPLITFNITAKPILRGQTRSTNPDQNFNDINPSLKYLFINSTKQVNKRLSQNIEYTKQVFNIQRNQAVAYDFNTKLSKITLEQYSNLIDNYNYNQNLLDKLVDEQSQKDVKKESINISKLTDAEIEKDITGEFEEPNEIDQFPGSGFKYKNMYLSLNATTKKEAIQEVKDRYNVDIQKIKEKEKFEILKQKALDKKAELESTYGELEKQLHQTLELEMNYFTPLVHHLIQKHINTYGRDFPMYFSGYNITKLTQGNDRTAMIYAGKDEINIINKNNFEINGRKYSSQGPLALFIDNNLYKVGGSTKTTQEDYDNAKKEYEKAYQQATELKTKEIKYQAAQQIGLIPLISYGEKVSLEEGIKRLNEYKKQSKQNLDRAVNTIMNISNNKPIETGAIYNAMSQVSGVKLIWQDNIKGLNGNPGGYLVDLSNYNFNTPVLFGLSNKKEQEITLNINNQDIEKLSNLPTNIQEYMLSLTKEDLSKVIDTLKEYDNLDYLPDDNTYIDMLKCKI